MRKAYDKVWREGLWKVLRDLGYGGRVLAIIKDLYTGLTATVDLNGIVSESISLGAGVRQGCVLSPLLFDLYLRDLEERLIKEGVGVEIGPAKNIPGMFFADDIVLLAEGGKSLQRLLDIVGDFGEERKLVFNEKKCMVMVNEVESKDNVFVHSFNSKRKYNIGGRNIKTGDEKIIYIGECEEYKYLGVVISTGKNVLGSHVDMIVKKMERVRGVLRKITRDSFNRKWIAKIGWEMVALPALLYGLEAVSIREVDVQKLERQQILMARYILGLPKYVALEVLYGELGWLKIKDHVLCRRLCFDMHLSMLGEDKWHKAAWEEVRNKRNRVGNVVYSWEKDMVKYMKCLDWEREEMVELRSKCEIKKKIEEMRVVEWKKGMEGKSSLKWYKDKKWGKVRYLELVNECEWLSRARGNVMRVKSKTVKWGEGDGLCVGCKEVSETLEHIFFECDYYDDERVRMGKALKDEGDWKVVNSTGSSVEKMKFVLGIDGVCIDVNMDDKDFWLRRNEMVGYFWRRRLLLEKMKGDSIESSMSEGEF